MNIDSSLTNELKDKVYRDAYVASQINIGLPFQVRALRNSRQWKQGELAERTSMSQPRISEIETPGGRSLNIATLLRLASAFDVGLDIRFVPFSELVDRSEGFDPDDFTVKSFNEDIAELQSIGCEQGTVFHGKTEIPPNIVVLDPNTPSNIFYMSGIKIQPQPAMTLTTGSGDYFHGAIA